MATKIIGSASGNIAEVNTDNEVKISLSKILSKIGYAGLAGVIGSDLSGQTKARNIRSSMGNRLAVGQDHFIDGDVFNYTVQNSSKYSFFPSTMNASFAGGFFNTNSAAITTANTGVNLFSRRYFTLPSDGGLAFECFAQLTAVGVSNMEHYMGDYIQTSPTSAPTDGVYFKITSAGLFGSFVNNSGTEVNTLLIATLNPNQTYKLRLHQYNREANFFVDDVLLGTLTATAGTGQLTYNTAYSSGFSTRILATAASVAAQLKINSWSLYTIDTQTNLLHREHKANGNHAAGGWTQGMLGRYTNNTNQTAAVPTNTTAALGTGLGGEFVETDTLAVNTDGIICSFQNPAYAIGVQPKTIMIRGVKINSFVSTALTGGGYQAVWTLNYGHTSVSLATAEGGITKAPRRKVLGSYPTAAAAALNVTPADVVMRFEEPIAVYPGEFIAIAKKKVGTAPTAGAWTHFIEFDFYLAD